MVDGHSSLLLGSASWLTVYLLVIYQVGGLVTGEVSFNPFTIVAFILILAGLWGLFRPYKEAATLSDSEELAVEKAMA